MAILFLLFCHLKLQKVAQEHKNFKIFRIFTKWNNFAKSGHTVGYNFAKSGHTVGYKGDLYLIS